MEDGGVKIEEPEERRGRLSEDGGVKMEDGGRKT